jgi:DNA-binding transcriptional MerR regulator
LAAKIVGIEMPDLSKRLQKNGSAKRARKTFRFMPSVPVPPELDRETIAIADMANAFGVTHRTLHFYEEKGLLASDRAGLMRIYHASDAHQMAVVNLCREVGMPVADIQDLLERIRSAESQEDADQTFQEALEARRRELTANMSALHRQMQQITDYLEGETGASPTNDNRTEHDLSDAERECLELMAEGYTLTRLSRAMQISPEKVQELEVSIIRKFDANNRFQAVAKAVLLGIVKT